VPSYGDNFSSTSFISYVSSISFLPATVILQVRGHASHCVDVIVAAMPMRIVGADTRLQIEMLRSIPTAANPVSTPPLAPLMASASRPRIQRCILVT